MLPADPIPPPQLGPYRLLRELARGGMGAVYEAEHVETGARVALKRILPNLLASLEPDALARFRREAELSARLRHPGIVPVHAADLEGPDPYLVQAFYPGGSLAERVRGRGPLAPAEALELGRRLAEALACAHAAGIVHRDLKPQNLLFDERGEPAITDFGLAVSRGDARTLTQTGELLGTPAYMPPEQIADSRAADARSDLYALGAVLYYALSGEPPFRGGSVYEVLQRVLESDPPPLDERVPGLPDGLTAVVARAMHKDPAQRFADANALAAALAAAGSETPAPARSWTLAGLVALALAVAAGLLAAAAGASSTPTAAPRGSVAAQPSPSEPPPDPPALVEAAAAVAAGDSERAAACLNRWEGAGQDDRDALELGGWADEQAHAWSTALSDASWSLEDLLELPRRLDLLGSPHPRLQRAVQRRVWRAVARWIFAAPQALVDAHDAALGEVVAREDPDPDQRLALRGAWVWRTVHTRARKSATGDANWELDLERWSGLPESPWLDWGSLAGWELVWTALSVLDIPAEHSFLDARELIRLAGRACDEFDRLLDEQVQAPTLTLYKRDQLFRRRVHHVMALPLTGKPADDARHAARIVALGAGLDKVDENRWAIAEASLFGTDPARVFEAAAMFESDSDTQRYLRGEAHLLAGRLRDAQRELELLTRRRLQRGGAPPVPEEALAAYIHVCRLLGEAVDSLFEGFGSAETTRLMAYVPWRTLEYTRRILDEGAWWPGRGVVPRPPR